MLYIPPDPWLQNVDAPGCWEIYHAYSASGSGAMWRLRGGFDAAALQGVDDCRKLYDAEIAYTDHEIGRLLDGLAGLRDRPRLIVLTADHGENFGEEGSFFEHGDNAHDSALRVPLVFAGPGVAAGRVDRGVASLEDVVPTLFSLLEVPERERPPTEGRDLSGRLAPAGRPQAPDEAEPVVAESGVVSRNQFFRTLLTGRAAYRACINGERYTLCDVHDGQASEPRLYDHALDPGLTRDVAGRHPAIVARLLEARKRWPVEGARIRASRTPLFKLVQRPVLEGGYREELYDLREDPGETRDVAALHPEVAAKLRAALDEWRPPSQPVEPLDPEVEESLRSLGYLP
jgi:arylsulfatase A-like enzyme